jgi:hypothetical protein
MEERMTARRTLALLAAVVLGPVIFATACAAAGEKQPAEFYAALGVAGIAILPAGGMAVPRFQRAWKNGSTVGVIGWTIFGYMVIGAACTGLVTLVQHLNKM